MDFSKYLQNDEKIIQELRPSYGKGSTNKNTKAISIILIIILIIHISVTALIMSSDDKSPIVIITITFLLFEVLSISGLIYNIFIKKKVIQDDYYCITNKRVFKYDLKKDKLVFGYIINYTFDIRNEKDKAGDLYMQVDLSSLNNSNDMKIVSITKNILMHPNPTNRPFICFECIEDVNDVYKTILNLQKELKNGKRGYLCPCCNNEFYLLDQTCKNCGFDLNYSVKDVEKEGAILNTAVKMHNTITKIIIIAVAIFMILVLLLTLL